MVKILTCHVKNHGFKSRSFRIKKNKKILIVIFRKILKNLKFLIKKNINFIFINNYSRKYFFIKKKIFFLFLKKKINFLKKKNLVCLYFLDNVGNINSCIRTCYIFNVYCLVKKSVFFFNNFLIVKNIKKKIFFLKKKLIIISLSIKSFFVIKKFFIKKKFLIIIGNEKKSLKKSIIKISDYIIKIYINCKKSLNVTVVNGIILFHIFF